MRAKTLQIVWHNQEPVFSVDFNRGGVLASAGGDKEIKVSWRAQHCSTRPQPISHSYGTSPGTVRATPWSSTLAPSATHP